MQTLSPVQHNEREIFMDMLRGFAILGIFIANLGSGFSFYDESLQITGPFLLPGWDHKMRFLHAMFIEGKFYSIFSLLFGWGIALQVKRGLAKGIDVTPTLKRRLTFMLLLGACHLLLWSGDIVFFYALLGFVLLPLRKFSNKTLLISGGILILSPILLYGLKLLFPVLNFPSELLNYTGMQVSGAMAHIKTEGEWYNMMKHGSWWDIIKLNVGGFFFRYGDLFFISRISKVLGMFLIGYVIGRSDFYKNIAQYKKIIYGVIAYGLLVAIPANYILAHYMMWYSMDYYSLKINGLYQTIAYAFGVAPLALTYVGVLMLCCQTAAGKKILSVFAPVGKMAFSNYILQTLVGSFVFLGPGLGYMQQVGPVCFTIFGIAIFCVQIIISTLWLKYFNFGPLEWLWRSYTYKKWQGMMKTTSS